MLLFYSLCLCLFELWVFWKSSLDPFLQALTLVFLLLQVPLELLIKPRLPLQLLQPVILLVWFFHSWLLALKLHREFVPHLLQSFLVYFLVSLYALRRWSFLPLHWLLLSRELANPQQCLLELCIRDVLVVVGVFGNDPKHPRHEFWLRELIIDSKLDKLLKVHVLCP